MSAPVLTPPQRRILRHALGLTHPRNISRRPYRNHYVTNPGADNWELVQSLVRGGLMSRGADMDGPSGNICFHVSPDGKRAVLPKVKRRRVPEGVEPFLNAVDQRIDDLASELARVVEGNPDLVGVDIVISRSKGAVGRHVSVSRRP